MLASTKSAHPSASANYIEDVFSTWLYTGNGSTQTITNGIDLSGKGGLVWTKSRSISQVGRLYDSARGTQYDLIPSLTNPQNLNSPSAMNFSSSGFGLVADNSNNQSGVTYASWTFREQPKFFDVVTYTGNGANRTIAHNLGSVPGCIIIKRTDTSDNWIVYHRSLGNDYELFLNLTNALNYTNDFNFTTPTSTVFSVNGNDAVNASGGTYVAYLFAHNAGGFGATGTDNVISCSSFTTDASGNAVVNLGYEPQWLMVKNATTASNNEWRMVDNMRGFPVDGASSSVLTANTSDAEFTSGTINILNTGFQIDGLANSATFIYIAIRRPMKTPTTGTEVFIPLTTSGTEATRTLTSNFVVDLDIAPARTGSSITRRVIDRLRGRLQSLGTNLTTAESTLSAGYGIGFDLNNGVIDYISTNNVNAHDYVNYLFRRAAGFFDVVCYTGTGVVRTVNHNLGVAPEMMIVKSRSDALQWFVYHISLGNNTRVELDSTAALITPTSSWATTNPTSTTFALGAVSGVNGLASTFVAYLFATVAGVSKVGSYTGNGSSQTINCSFTAGARFIMIKRTDSTGDWYVWDTARGISAGSDSHLSLNTTAVEVTTDDSVDADSSGFIVNQVAATNVNVNAATYIFLAIA